MAAEQRGVTVYTAGNEGEGVAIRGAGKINQFGRGGEGTESSDNTGGEAGFQNKTGSHRTLKA